jgi:hypothetical protein
MTILDYPEEECTICHGNTWWYSKLDPNYKGPATWVCGECHPPAGEIFNKMRIIKGTYLLNKMRHLLEKEDLLEGIALIKELWTGISKTDCLYIEDGKKLKKCVPEHNNQVGLECFACPNNYWWEVELWEPHNHKKQVEAKPEPAPQPTIQPGMF